MGSRFSISVQTGPEAHQVYCTVGTGSQSQGQSDQCVALTSSPPSSAEVKERVELYTHWPLCAFMVCYRVTFTFLSTLSPPYCCAGFITFLVQRLLTYIHTSHYKLDIFQLQHHYVLKSINVFFLLLYSVPNMSPLLPNFQCHLLLKLKVV
jgi:hypothetical protein